MPTGLFRFAALLAATFVLALPALAQTELQPVPPDWPHLDLERDGFAGISTDRAYEEILQGRVPQRSVIVAVIDSGVDTSHTGLAGRMWTNPDASDTGRGYFGDRFGWSFLGNRAGGNVEHDTYEYAREYARLKPLFGEHADTTALVGENAEKYAYFVSVRDSLNAKRAELAEYGQLIAMMEMARRMAHDQLSGHFGTEDYLIAQVEKLETNDPRLLQAQEIMVFLAQNDLSAEKIAEHAEYVDGMLTYSLNPEFDPRHIVGDDYDDLTERYYGSPDVQGPDPSHGTGVASVIAGLHAGDFGVRGVAADSVFIMAVRAVPQGDERDKDVANAIRYAVDNGAHVINMSFGKPLSPHKEVVDAAVRHAMANGVLMIHAAGNDARDLTTAPSFPSRHLDDGEEAELWIEVGASTAFGEMLAASFSNYGAGMVDVFAPGESIRVLKPGNGVGSSDGTSFAAPHVAGLAALLMSHYPQLTPAQVRQIILESAVTMDDLEVLRPGSESRMVPFSALSTTGGVINAYRALRLAEEMAPQP